MENKQLEMRRLLRKYNKLRAFEKLAGEKKEVFRNVILETLTNHNDKYEDDDWLAYIERLGGEEVKVHSIDMGCLTGPWFNRKDFVEMIKEGILIPNINKYTKFIEKKGLEMNDALETNTVTTQKVVKLQVKAKGLGRIYDKEKKALKMV